MFLVVLAGKLEFTCIKVIHPRFLRSVKSDEHGNRPNYVNSHLVITLYKYKRKGKVGITFVSTALPFWYDVHLINVSVSLSPLKESPCLHFS